MNYKHPYYGVCFYCVRDGSYHCDECMHHTRETFDLWEPVDGLTMREKEEANRAEVIAETIHEWVEVETTAEFKAAYEKALRCTAYIQNRRELMGVLATRDGCLVASDTIHLCEIICPHIPEELKGCIIMALGDGKAGICRAPYPAYKNLLKTDHPGMKCFDIFGEDVITEVIDISQMSEKVLKLQLGDTAFGIMKKRYDLVVSTLKPPIIAYCTPGDSWQSLVFSGANGKMVVATIRRDYG